MGRRRVNGLRHSRCRVADYFSRPVLIGYIHGIAVVLIVGQLGKLFGFDIDAQDPLPQLVEFSRDITDSSASTVAAVVACLGELALLRWLTPNIPGPLVVLALAIAASAALDLAARGVAIVGEIPADYRGESDDLRVGDSSEDRKRSDRKTGQEITLEDLPTVSR